MLFPLLLLLIEHFAAQAIAEEGVAGALFAGGDLDLALGLGLYLCLRLAAIGGLATVALAGLLALIWEGLELLRERLKRGAVEPRPPSEAR
jgi:hypothetical protein